MYGYTHSNPVGCTDIAVHLTAFNFEGTNTLYNHPVYSASARNICLISNNERMSSEFRFLHLKISGHSRFVNGYKHRVFSLYMYFYIQLYVVCYLK